MKAIKSILTTVVMFFLLNTVIGATNAKLLPVTFDETTELSTTSSSTLLRNFCKNNAKVISFFAHPTSEYKYSSVEISGRNAYLTITSLDAWSGDYNKMKVKVWVNGMGFIGGVKLLQDDDFWPAFVSMTLLKSVVDDLMKENRGNESIETAKSVTSQILDETYYQWDGKGLCLFLLNTYWLDSGYYSRY